MGDKIAVPFYLNENLINEIYAIIIQKYANIKSITRKKQCIVKLTTPLSNIIEGKYVQGDLSIQILNEYSRERIDESVSIIIETFIDVLDILEKKEILKHINNEEDLNNIENNDYILINSKIEKMSSFKNIEKMVNIMEAEQIFRIEEDSHSDKVLKSLKEYLDNFTNNECIKYLSEDFLKRDLKFIFPLRRKFMRGDIEHLINSNVFIFAKVINFCNNLEEKERALKMGGCFDYLEDVLANTCYEGFKQNSRGSKLNYVGKYTFVETIPIAIYI